MRLTTIGTGTVAPHPARACAAHLVEMGDVRLLLDCGHGAVHRMAALRLPWTAITHVALTHFHPDHIGDLPLLVMAWRYGTLPPREAPLALLGPPGTADLMERLAAAFGTWMLEPGFPLSVEEIPDGEARELAPDIRLAARTVPHTEESVAYSITHRGRRLVYTGDTAFDAGLAEWAKGADVLLAECSLPDAMAVEAHLTPAQCGALARLARPGRLVLTHFYPPVEREDIAGIIRGDWDGSVTLAMDGWTTMIGDN